VVLADRYSKEYATRINNDLKVIRVWRRDTFLYPFELFRAVVSEKPDVIHVHHEYYLFGRPHFSAIFPILIVLLHLFRRPVVVTMHSVIPSMCLTSNFLEKYGSGKRFATIKKIYFFLMTMLMGSMATKIIVHCESARRALIKDYKFKSTKICVIPHGVDIFEEKFDQHYAKRKLNLERKKVLLFFGLVRPGKGIECLIEAMPSIVQQCSNATLMIVGTSHPYLISPGKSYLKGVEELVHKLRLEDNVFFVNKFVPNRELPLYFIAADLIILPYTESDIIGASGALSSIKSFKKPVIATRVRRFIGDITDGENGILIPPSDSASLARAATLLLSNAEIGRKLGVRLYNEAKDNCWENVAWRTLTLYKDIVSS